jgi:hypothetical protein
MSHELEQLAQDWWYEMTDDDACCIGHPEGAEYVEEAIIPKLTALLSRVRDEERLEEAKWWHNAPHDCKLFPERESCQRIVKLERALASTATAEESK